MFLTKVEMSKNKSLSDIFSMMISSGHGDARGLYHKLIWSLFDGDPNEKRHFLFREIKKNTFIILSEKKPHEHSDVFGPIQIKEFEPVFSVGRVFHFSLEAHLSVRNDQGRRVDPIAWELSKLPQEEKAWKGDRIVDREVRRWIEGKAKAFGFSLNDLNWSDYHHETISRRGKTKKRDEMRMNIVKYSGILTVNDTEKFMEGYSKGIGRGKAFGCGLLLLMSM